MNAVVPTCANNTETVSFLGVTLQPRSLPELNVLVEQGIREHQRWIIANHNLHSLYLFHRYAKMRELYAQARWTHIDGMPLIALGRLYGFPLERKHRVTLADWTYPLMELAASKGWRVFHLGASRGSAEKGVSKLRQLYPTLQIEVSEGYFDARSGGADNEAMLQRINAYAPDLLMVGMGMPRQEFWTHENWARLDVPVILSSVGAAFDYVAGAVPTPPRWSGQIGLEWAFRMAHDPARLFKRYFVEPWYILLLLLMDYPRHRSAVKFRAGEQEISQAGS